MQIVYLHVCKQARSARSADVPLVELIYLVFTHMPGESYRRQLRSLLFVLV